VAITTLWRVPSSLFFNEQKIPPAKDNVSFGIRSGEVCFLLKKTDAVAIRQRLGWLWHFFTAHMQKRRLIWLWSKFWRSHWICWAQRPIGRIFLTIRNIDSCFGHFCCARAERQFLLPAQSCFLRNFTAKIWRSLKWRFFRDLWHMTQANSAFYLSCFTCE